MIFVFVFTDIVTKQVKWILIQQERFWIYTGPKCFPMITVQRKTYLYCHFIMYSSLIYSSPDVTRVGLEYTQVTTDKLFS